MRYSQTNRYRVSVCSSAWVMAIIVFGWIFTNPLGHNANVFANPPQAPNWRVWPEAIVLTGSLDGAQLLVLGQAQGSAQDLTRQAQYSVVPPGLVRVDSSGWVEPLRDGNGYIEVRCGKAAQQVAVQVRDITKPPQVSFHKQVMAVLSSGGCSGGTCHGSPSGKNGFRLSLWGANPTLDYFALTRELGGRRTSAVEPLESLVLRKALGRIPHEGGVRFARDSLAARIMDAWLRSAMPYDDSPTDTPEIEVEPKRAVLIEPQRQVQLVVRARFPKEDWRDVTRLCVFQSSEANVVSVSPTGLVTFRTVGEVAIQCRYLSATAGIRLAHWQPRRDFVWQAPPEANAVDKYVYARLKELQIRPAPLCSDHVFLRRIYIDLLGRLPRVDEVRSFLNDTDPAKRQKLVEKLLATPDFAEFWSRKWLDVLRANQKRLPREVLIGLQHWWQERLHNNVPFDELVRELLTASGNTRENPAAAYFSVNATPEEAAETTAQVFLGIRIGCARCHNHPFERWTQEDYYGLAACFVRVERRPDSKTKSNRRQPSPQWIADKKDGELFHPVAGLPVRPKPLLGNYNFPDNENRRVILARWLTSIENPFFARALANRIWFHLFGHGIVDPPDDIRDTNPPNNDALLDFLATELIEHHFNIKHLIRLIACSNTYQFASSAPYQITEEQARFFARARPRLLTAEQLLDAISQVAEVPESFSDYPEVKRAVALPESLPDHPFLKAFGQPPRELPCECERYSEPNLVQALQLVNGSIIQKKITAPNNRIGRLLQSQVSDECIIEELYLAAFSRPPSDVEKQMVLNAVRQQTSRRAAWEDVLWVILNSTEFLYRP